MKAPSERHLEDWIMKNHKMFKNFDSEGGVSQFEVYLAQLYGVSAKERHPYIDNLFLRQVELHSGIPDLIGLRHDHIVVVELKKNVVNEKCLIQLMKYIKEIEHIALFRETEIVSNWFDTHVNITKVVGLAVGYGQPSKQTIYGRPASISIIRYDFDGLNYKFTSAQDDADYGWINHKQPISPNPSIMPLVDHMIIKAHAASKDGAA